MTETPAALGYRMPAEWEPHEATWIAWPHNRDDWPGKFGPIPWVYVEIVRHLSRVERVEILVEGREGRATGGRPARPGGRRPRPGRVPPGQDRPGLDPRLGPDVRGQGRRPRRARAWSTGSSTPGRSTTTTAATAASPGRSARSWACGAGSPGSTGRRREPGPGGPGRGLDRRQRPGDAADDRGMPAQRGPGPEPPARPRGGSSRSSPTTSATPHVVWLGRGIAGDDTHGHVDDLARFVDPATVVTVVEPDPSDENHEPLRENLGRLRAAPRPGRPAAPGGRAADAPAGRLRGAAAPGQLRQLLHRQRPGPGPDLQRPGRPRGAGHPGRGSSPAARSSASTPSTSSGASGRSTA